MVKLVQRWAFFDKSYKIPQMKKELKDHPKFLDWVLSTDKQDHTKLYKKNMEPFERLFLELGAEIMKNMTNFLSANPSKSTRIMIKDLNSLIKKINASDDVNVINKLKTQLDRLNSIGVFDAIVPSEGITLYLKQFINYQLFHLLTKLDYLDIQDRKKYHIQWKQEKDFEPTSKAMKKG